MFNYPEGVISEPLTPKAIVSMVYEKCMPHNPIEVVMQQEVRTGIIIIYALSYNYRGYPIALTCFSDHYLPGCHHVEFPRQLRAPWHAATENWVSTAQHR